MEREYEDQIARLMAEKRTDELTRLGNYRAFREYIMLLRDLGVGFSVVLFDMTNLKKANEALGHFGADILLCNVGQLIRGSARDGAASDSVFRHGGDEFAVVLPCCPTGGALRVRDDIESAVGVTIIKDGYKVQAVGAVCTIVPGMDLDAELNRADKELERRKAKVKQA